MKQERKITGCLVGIQNKGMLIFNIDIIFEVTF